MSDIEELTKELRGYFRWQKRVSRWSLAILVPVMVAVVSLAILEETGRWPFRRAPAPPSWSWRDVSEAMSHGNPDQALEIANVLIKKTPDYYTGHWWLGGIHLTKGNVEEAECHFARAHELFPTENNEDRLRAVRKLLKQKE